jgi:hypothetical protein
MTVVESQLDVKATRRLFNDQPPIKSSFATTQKWNTLQETPRGIGSSRLPEASLSSANDSEIKEYNFVRHFLALLSLKVL